MMLAGVVTITSEDDGIVLVAGTDDAENAGKFVEKAMRLAPSVTDPREVAKAANLLYRLGHAAQGSFDGASDALLIQPTTYRTDAIAAVSRHILRLRNGGYSFATWNADTTMGTIQNQHGQGMGRTRASRRCNCSR